MRVTIDFAKHKNETKAYDERLDPWPQKRPLEILKISNQKDLKIHFYNYIWKKK